MISPSKVKHKQQKQQSRDNSDIHSHVRLQKGRKPLERKSFYLDIKNHALSGSLEAKIKDLGGAIELFLVKSVTLVVSDRADKLGQNNCDKKKWGYGSGESGGPPSLKSIEVPTPISTPPTPYGGEYPLSNSTNIRGQTAQRTKSRADAMLERALTQPQQCSVDPLNNAQNWGIPIWPTKRLQGWLEKIYESLKDNGNLKRIADHSNTEKSLKVKHLKNSYIKFESFKRDTRPVFLELPVWPKLNFDGDPGTCPFDNRIREKKVCKEGSDSLNKNKSKEMTRRPRATATRARRTEQLVGGSCEICRIDYRDLSKHLQSDKHLAFVRNDDNFLSLDKLINSGASVEAFLRANEVGQDCNIYPDGERSLNSDDIDDEKVNDSAKADLSNFDEIKMVQCNGARRSLNLKLNPSHNLRTRSKHESGHLLRSKGSPWHEVQDKSDKFYDKFEGYTIKKRAKGTIWIEEDEIPVKKCSMMDETQEKSNDDDKTTSKKVSINDEKALTCKIKETRDQSSKKSDAIEDRVLPKLERNDLSPEIEHENDNSRITKIPRLEKETRVVEETFNRRNGVGIVRTMSEDNGDDCKNGFNGFERVKPPESFPASQLPGNSRGNETNRQKASFRDDQTLQETSKELEKSNGINDKTAKNLEVVEKELKNEKSKISRIGKRSGRGFRGRPRLSVEERLIEDNRAYYKVEVLGNKLRSSTGPWTANVAPKAAETETAAPTTLTTEAAETRTTTNCSEITEVGKKNEERSSEKPVVVRFKRVRKSELSLLSDEAESFMFGDPKRDDETSEVSDDDQSSVLPRETESDWDTSNNVIGNNNDFTISSSTINSSSPIKQEIIVEEDSQDSMYNGRARKRRRTQAEALIKDNEDYYKFETPGSRLRFQAPLTGFKDQNEFVDISDETIEEKVGKTINEETPLVEKLYPSKPSPEVEKMQFSFEAVPRSEPWYQTYQRQDEGSEFWHYFSESDERKPFLLPYEIENFHETLAKLCQKSESRGKKRRGPNGLGRSPRKSPRCHASTLAIMSTIIRKRELNQQSTTTATTTTANLSIVEEEKTPGCSSSSNETPKIETKLDEHPKSDVDVELREIARNIDEMLSAEDILDPDDSFETGLLQQQAQDPSVDCPNLQRGAPSDLLDLLDNCHEYYNCRENSSCASSECGEGNAESPLKRRKKRKNRTGWPGIKMRKKQTKSMDSDAERDATKKITEDNAIFGDNCDVTSEVYQRLRDDGRTMETGSPRRLENSNEDDEEITKIVGETENLEKGSLKTLKRDVDAEVSRELSRNNEDVAKKAPLQCETITGSEDASTHLEASSARKKSSPEERLHGNDENHENFSETTSPRQLSTKIGTRKRQRVHETSSEIDSRNEIENNDSMYINSVKTTIISRKNYTTNGLSKLKRTARDSVTSVSPEGHEEIIEHHHREIVGNCQKDEVRKAIMRTRKRQRRGTLRNEVDYEDENCKTDDYSSSIKSNNKTDNLRMKRRCNDSTVTSETHDSDLECGLDERVSPSLLPTTELKNRRSSIEFQPVVRMMKIEDQVDMDHSILSVTVASNRRLRSSSSPRSNVQQPAKRYKRSKGPFGRWIKNS